MIQVKAEKKKQTNKTVSQLLEFMSEYMETEIQLEGLQEKQLFLLCFPNISGSVHVCTREKYTSMLDISLCEIFLYCKS